MLRHFSLRIGSTNPLMVVIGVVLGLTMLMGSSCDPEQSVVESPQQVPPAKKQSISQSKPNEGLNLVVDAICRGEFDHARQNLTLIDADDQARTMGLLMDRYDQIQQRRQQKQQAAFEEQLAELEDIKEQIASIEVPDVNDIDKAMAALIRAREYALPEQKEELLNDPFMQTALIRMKTYALENEQQGNWLDAYAHSYFWLSTLYEDNKEYQEKTEELMVLSSIELALKDSSCGETVIERYEGIKPVMFLRALQLLNSNYVNSVDYHQMAEKAVKRCRLLSKVLECTNETLSWSADKEQIAEWNTGLDTLWDVQGYAAMPPEDVQVDHIAKLLDDILILNSITLKMPEEVIVAHFAEASFASLDPFTNLVWPWNVKDFEKSMTQQFTGIGVEISNATGVLKVVSLLPDKPAYKSGQIDADDEILAVDGELTKEMSIYCAVQKITGTKGTKVTLSMRRPSTDETWDVTIVRDKIVVQPLRGWVRDASGKWDYMIDPENRIGYIRLTSFTESSGPELDTALRKLEKTGLNGLILDLRFNSGGYLQAAAEVVDLFVKEGVIVKSSPRQGMPTYEIAHRSGTHPDYPLVVLINESSASASEIVAGALQDAEHFRATLVGQRSYGKGSVQVVTPYTGGGSQLKYTVAYYHLPSDQQVKNRYQMEKMGRKDWGIAADVEVKMFSNEIKEMIDIQRGNDVLTRIDHEANGGEVHRHTLRETLQADPQLSIGLLVLQSKLVAQGHRLQLDSMLADNTSEQANGNEVH